MCGEIGSKDEELKMRQFLMRLCEGNRCMNPGGQKRNGKMHSRAVTEKKDG